MNASDLRINNWVLNTTTCEYMLVYPMMIHQLSEIERKHGSLDESNINPIPLTEEILLKCGFVLGMKMQSFVKGKYCFVDKKDGFLYGEFSEEDIFYFNSRTKIKHLHQLQNLYFALTGKELNIDL